MYTQTTAYEEMSSKTIIEYELKGKSWGSLEDADEAKMAKSNAVYINYTLKMHRKRHLSNM